MRDAKKNILLGLVCLGAGFGVGWLAGRGTPASEETVQPAATTIPAEYSAEPISATELPVQPNATKRDSPLDRLGVAAKYVSAENLASCLNIINELPAGDCRNAGALFNHWPLEERNVLLRSIAKRWAFVDAEGALRVAFSNRDVRSQLTLIQESARAMAKRSVEDAEARFHSLTGSQERRLFGRFVVEAVAEDDPPRAAELLARWTDLTRDEDLFGTVGAQWARARPSEALAWALSLPAGRPSGDAVKAVLSKWAESDPNAVASEVKRIQGRRIDPEVYQAIARAWSRNDPGAAVAWLATLSPDDKSRAAWDGFAPIVRIEDGPAMLRLIQEIQGDHHRAMVAERVAGQFSQQNPKLALAWAELLEGEARRRALRPALNEWARSDPAQAVNYAAALPVNHRMELLRPAFGQWAGSDSAAAMAWIHETPPGPDREQLAVDAARAVGEMHPANAVAWLDLVAAPDARRKMVDEIGGNWGRMDGSAAAAWVQDLPDEESRIRGHRSVARQWAFVDADAAAQWLATLSSGAARDAAIDAYVSSVDGYDPAAATAWAAAIGDPVRRAEKVAAAWSRWSGSDPERARGWLDQAAIDTNLRAKLQQEASQIQRNR